MPRVSSPLNERSVSILCYVRKPNDWSIASYYCEVSTGVSNLTPVEEGLE
jgi:hypothetical protein